jgi:hypothetical protein
MHKAPCLVERTLLGNPQNGNQLSHHWRFEIRATEGVIEGDPLFLPMRPWLTVYNRESSLPAPWSSICRRLHASASRGIGVLALIA